MLKQVTPGYDMLGQVKPCKATFDKDRSGSDILVQVRPG
jgi:hypothetical protein